MLREVHYHRIVPKHWCNQAHYWQQLTDCEQVSDSSVVSFSVTKKKPLHMLLKILIHSERQLFHRKSSCCHFTIGSEARQQSREHNYAGSLLLRADCCTKFSQDNATPIIRVYISVSLPSGYLLYPFSHLQYILLISHPLIYAAIRLHIDLFISLCFWCWSWRDAQSSWPLKSHGLVTYHLVWLIDTRHQSACPWVR